MSKRYWYCIIGPVEGELIPPGGDGPPRGAARDAVIAMTGQDTTCASGWIDQSEFDKIRKAQFEHWRDDRGVKS